MKKSVNFTGVLLAVLVCFPLLMILAVAVVGVGGVTQASVCTGAGGGHVAIGTLNWRGSSHYDRNPHPHESTPAARMPYMIDAITASGATIVGFQEFEQPQAALFTQQAGSQWALVEGQDGGGHPDPRDAIAYRRDQWTPAQVTYLTIRYSGSAPVQIPLVKFTSADPATSVWVLNTHNPDEAVGGTHTSRRADVDAEAAALTQTLAADPGTPALFTGDMNDRAAFRDEFLTNAGAGWNTANPDASQIDWILGSSGVTFTDTAVDQTTNDGAFQYTDHPFIHAVAALPGTQETTAPMDGTLTLAQANIPARSGAAGFNASMPRLLSHSPDFVTLNEQAARSLGTIEAASPGYTVYRDLHRDHDPGSDQTFDTVVLWRTDTWTQLTGGRVKLINDELEPAVHGGGVVVRDRFATWATLRRADGVIASIVSVHMPVNPGKYGPNPPLRQQQYGQGMDGLVALVNQLQAHGAVFVGGDFNVHPSQLSQAWTGPAKMQAAGYSWAVDNLDYLFYPQSSAVAPIGSWTGSMVSDPNWISTSLALNGYTTTPPATTDRIDHVDRVAEPPPDVAPQLMQLRLAPGYPTLSADQANNAITIAQVAAQLGVPRYGLHIALATAVQESKLNNLSGGDADSLGLFQQRPSAGWGIPADITDPALATRAFFGESSHTNNRGLLDIADWQSLPLAEAASQIQQPRADLRGEYATWTSITAQMADLLGGGSSPSNPCSDEGPGHGTGPFTPSAIPYVGSFDPATLTARMQAVLRADGLPNVDPFFGTQPDGSWFRDCQRFVAILQGRPSSGFASAAAGWSHFVAAGKAHPVGTGDAMSPPVGAWLYYGPDHVVVYLGDNLVAGTDTWGTGTAKIGPDSDISDGIWHLPYLGWAAPWGI